MKATEIIDQEIIKEIIKNINERIIKLCEESVNNDKTSISLVEINARISNLNIIKRQLEYLLQKA